MGPRPRPGLSDGTVRGNQYDSDNRHNRRNNLAHKGEAQHNGRGDQEKCYNRHNRSNYRGDNRDHPSHRLHDGRGHGNQENHDNRHDHENNYRYHSDMTPHPGPGPCDGPARGPGGGYPPCVNQGPLCPQPQGRSGPGVAPSMGPPPFQGGPPPRNGPIGPPHSLPPRQGMSTALLCLDSRGRPLEAEIRKINDSQMQVQVEFQPGANIEGVCALAREFCQNDYDFIYISAGVNEITKREGFKQYFFNWTSQEELENYLQLKFDTEIKKLKDDMLNTKTKIICCALPGIHLERTCVNSTPQHQNFVDAAVWKTNQHIDTLNKTASVTTPWLSRSVHTSSSSRGNRRRGLTSGTSRRSRRRAVKYHLLGDGIHLSGKVVEKWAKLFVNHFKCMRSLHYLL